MPAIEKMKSAFSGLGSSYTAAPLTFNEIDIQKNKKKMRLKEVGAQRGASNLPRTDAIEIDDTEEQIVSWINSEAKSAAENIHDHLQSFQYRMQNMRGVGNVAKMEQITSAAEGEFSAKVLARKAELFTTREAVSHIKARFEGFKSKHGLEGDASYPESRFYHFSIVLLLVGVETIVNGQFFGKASEGGLLGGITEAFAFSAINAVLGFFLGFYVTRLCLAPNLIKKAIGVLLCILVPLCMLFINLLLAWYRANLTALAEGAVFDSAKAILISSDPALSIGTLGAVQHFTVTLVSSLNSLDSILLFALGVLCCIIITIDFWLIDDPFPGFGRLSREYKAKIETYADMKSAILDELSETQQESHKALDEVLNNVSAMSSETETIHEAQNRWRRLYDAHLDHLEDAGRQLLKFYRASNEASRTTDVPLHFNQPWVLKRPPLPEPDDGFNKAIEGIQAETKSVQAAHVSCLQRISNAYNGALKEYQSVDEL